jgi:hypothetical protein
MRSSSIKSAVAVFALALTLILAAPTAHAATPKRSRDFDRIVETVRRVVRRFTGGITANDGPSSGGTTIPIPPPDNNGQ